MNLLSQRLQRFLRWVHEEPIIAKPVRVTIKDMAAGAGVSIATVSNVVDGTGRVGRATKERVRPVIQRM